MSALSTLLPAVRSMLALARKDRARARAAVAALSLDEQTALVCDAPAPLRSELFDLVPAPEEVVPRMPAAEVCTTARALGLSEAGWLLDCATSEQLVAAIDLDAWRHFDFDRRRMGEWLVALNDAEDKTVLRAAQSIDLELLMLQLKACAQVVMKTQEDDWEPPTGGVTLDGVFYLVFRSPLEQGAGDAEAGAESDATGVASAAGADSGALDVTGFPDAESDAVGAADTAGPGVGGPGAPPGSDSGAPNAGTDAVPNAGSDAGSDAAGAADSESVASNTASPEADSSEGIMKLLRVLFQKDYWVYFRLLQSVIWELVGENEESALRWRSGRLQDLGFPDPADAKRIYSFLRPEHLARLPEATGPKPTFGKDEAPVTWWPSLLESAGEGATILRVLRAMAPEAREHLQHEFITLANQVALADALPLGEYETPRSAVEKAATLGSRGLEHLAAVHGLGFEEVLQRAGVLRLFQVGHNLAHRDREDALAHEDRESP